MSNYPLIPFWNATPITQAISRGIRYSVPYPYSYSYHVPYQGKEYSGVEFNEIHKNTKFYKFLNDNLTHFDFTYKEELNVDTVLFNPNDSCSSGGLYFCEESNCHHFWRNYGKKVAIIKIPDNAQVYTEEFKFKADRLYIEEIIDIEMMPNDFWFNIFQHDNLALQHITKPCVDSDSLIKDLCKIKVQKNGLLIQYIKESSGLLTKELCELAVKQNGLALQYVKDKNLMTTELCTLAVQQDGFALQYVDKDLMTIELCKLAVQQNGSALQFINDQTEELCTLAVQQNGFALQYVKKQTEELCTLAIRQGGFLVLRLVNEEFSNLLTKEQYSLALQTTINGLLKVREANNKRYSIYTEKLKLS